MTAERRRKIRVPLPADRIADHDRSTWIRYFLCRRNIGVLFLSVDNTVDLISGRTSVLPIIEYVLNIVVRLVCRRIFTDALLRLLPPMKYCTRCIIHRMFNLLL